jgi:hypothetical protein
LVEPLVVEFQRLRLHRRVSDRRLQVVLVERRLLELEVRQLVVLPMSAIQRRPRLEQPQQQSLLLRLLHVLPEVFAQQCVFVRKVSSRLLGALGPNERLQVLRVLELELEVPLAAQEESQLVLEAEPPPQQLGLLILLVEELVLVFGAAP